MPRYEVETDAGTVQVEGRNQSHAGALGIRKLGALRAMCVRELPELPKKVRKKADTLPLVLKAKKKAKKVTK